MYTDSGDLKSYQFICIPLWKAKQKLGPAKELFNSRSHLLQNIQPLCIWYRVRLPWHLQRQLKVLWFPLCTEGDRQDSASLPTQQQEPMWHQVNLPFPSSLLGLESTGDDSRSETAWRRRGGSRSARCALALWKHPQCLRHCIRSKMGFLMNLWFC